MNETVKARVEFRAYFPEVLQFGSNFSVFQFSRVFILAGDFLFLKAMFLGRFHVPTYLPTMTRIGSSLDVKTLKNIMMCVRIAKLCRLSFCARPPLSVTCGPEMPHVSNY